MPFRRRQFSKTLRPGSRQGPAPESDAAARPIVRHRYDRRCCRIAGARAGLAHGTATAKTMDLRIVGLSGMPEVRPGDSLAALIRAAAERAAETLDKRTI